jgi:hypothetical protein
LPIENRRAMPFPPAVSDWMDRWAAVSRYRVNKIGNIWTHCAISAQQNNNSWLMPRFDGVVFLTRTGHHIA